MMEHLLRNPGEYRNIQVGIEKVEYEPPPAILVPDLMKELLQWYRQNRKRMNPFELAVLVHTRFEIIHPFVDGNGRVGRALMNFVLKRAGYPTLYLGLEHRSVYLDALVLADGGTVAPIVGTLSDLYLNQHGKLVQEVRDATMDNSPIFKDENENIVRQLSALKKNE